MIVAVQMDFLIKRPNGVFAYRRRVPAELRLALGKREIQFSLKTKEQSVAIHRYTDAHRQAEAELSEARKKSPKVTRFEATQAELHAAGLWPEGEADYAPALVSSDEERGMAHARHLQAVASSLTKEEEQARNWNPDGRFERHIEAKFKGVQKPRMTLRDAFADYCKANDHRRNAVRLQQDGERVVAVLAKIMKEPDPELRSIKRTHALSFRDTLLEGGSQPSTVQRRVNTIKAILNHAVSEGREEGLVNYFNDLKVPNPSRSAAKELREALTVEEINRVSARIADKNEDIQDIWQILVHTGARVSEVTGLEWSDVFLDAEVPHIFIRPNETRDVKTISSKRRVPLVGVALEALERRSGAHDGHPQVFLRYSGERGSDAASELMLRSMKQAGVWERTRKVVHSLRHAHKDWMRRVAPQDICDLMHGHSSGGVSSSYGSDQRLEQLQASLEEALRVARV